MKRLCKWFGHKWIPIYVGKHKEWKIIAVYCMRCHYGNDELWNFIEKLGHKGQDFATYNKEYYEREAK